MLLILLANINVYILFPLRLRAVLQQEWSLDNLTIPLNESLQKKHKCVKQIIG